MLSQLQMALGLELKDLALLFGPLLFIIGLLMLGMSGNLYRRRWLTRLGWLLAIVGIAVAAAGIFHGTAPPPA